MYYAFKFFFTKHPSNINNNFYASEREIYSKQGQHFVGVFESDYTNLSVKNRFRIAVINLKRLLFGKPGALYWMRLSPSKTEPVIINSHTLKSTVELFIVSRDSFVY